MSVPSIPETEDTSKPVRLEVADFEQCKCRRLWREYEIVVSDCLTRHLLTRIEDRQEMPDTPSRAVVRALLAASSLHSRPSPDTHNDAHVQLPDLDLSYDKCGRVALVQGRLKYGLCRFPKRRREGIRPVEVEAHGMTWVGEKGGRSVCAGPEKAEQEKEAPRARVLPFAGGTRIV